MAVRSRVRGSQYGVLRATSNSVGTADTDLLLVLLQLERLNGSKLLDRLGDLSSLTCEKEEMRMGQSAAVDADRGAGWLRRVRGWS